MNRLTNPITMLGLIQLSFTGGGYVLTRALLRIWDRSWGPGMTEPSTLVIPRIIARYGLWAGVLTFSWCFLAAITASPDEGEGSVRKAVLISGILLTAIVALAFSCSVLGCIHALSGV